VARPGLFDLRKHRLKRFQPVGVARRFVPAQPGMGLRISSRRIWAKYVLRRRLRVQRRHPVAITLFKSSGDVTADRRHAFARDLAERGDFAAAADLLAQTVELAPGFAAAWFALGEAHEKLDRKAEAIAAYREVLNRDPDDPYGASLRLVRLGATDAKEMPANYVREVFDQYAGRFDDALTRGLAYKGPELLFGAVRDTCAASGEDFHFSSMLDLGCGTGLGAVPFRPFVDQLAGVDLSPNMVEMARGKNIYDRLAVGDIMTFLQGEADARRHLVVAADVFAYFADLAPVISASKRVLAAGGLLAFTVETHAGEGIILGDKLRYAHGAAHIRYACESAGLNVTLLNEASTRNEADIPVPGLIVVARRPAQR
jgi:predicted TPR repeat methyltransferase